MDVWGGSGSLACEALLLHTRILVTFNSTGNFHQICLKYHRFFSDVQVLCWISKDGIQKILNPYGAENLHKKDGLWKYVWYITSIAARGGGGSFKSEKIYESKEHVPIESFVTILIDWTFVLMTPTKWASVEVMCSDEVMWLVLRWPVVS